MRGILSTGWRSLLGPTSPSQCSARPHGSTPVPPGDLSQLPLTQQLFRGQDALDPSHDVLLSSPGSTAVPAEGESVTLGQVPFPALTPTQSEPCGWPSCHFLPTDLSHQMTSHSS